MAGNLKRFESRIADSESLSQQFNEMQIREIGQEITDGSTPSADSTGSSLEGSG